MHTGEQRGLARGSCRPLLPESKKRNDRQALIMSKQIGRSKQSSNHYEGIGASAQAIVLDRRSQQPGLLHRFPGNTLLKTKQN